MRNLRHREIKWPIQSHSARECRAETEAGTVWFQSTSDLNCYTLLPCWLSPNSNPNHFLVVYFVSPSIFHFYQKWHGAWAIVNTPDRTFLKQIIYGVIFAVHLFTHWLARFYLPFFFWHLLWNVQISYSSKLEMHMRGKKLSLIWCFSFASRPIRRGPRTKTALSLDSMAFSASVQDARCHVWSLSPTSWGKLHFYKAIVYSNNKSDTYSS